MASVFPKPNMDYIGRVLSELLSNQLGEEIVIRFTPKEGGETDGTPVKVPQGAAAK